MKGALFSSMIGNGNGNGWWGIMSWVMALEFKDTASNNLTTWSVAKDKGYNEDIWIMNKQ